MKTLGLSLAAVLAAANPGWAQAPAATQAPAARPSAATEATAKTKMHRMNGEVVSFDTEKKTITVKVDGAEKTSPVGPIAMYSLKKLKPGDKVVITCKDDAATGQHIEVAFVRLLAPEPAAATEKK